MKHNPNKVRIYRTYSRKELAKVYNVCTATINAWRRAGLPAIADHYPFLYKGNAVREFLRRKRTSKKAPLKENEFYCFRCKVARESIDNIISLQETGKLLGNGSKQLIKKGVCNVCGASLCRLASSSG